MKLYYSAGSCSTSCHIALEESGLPYQAIEVDWDNANDPNIELVNKLNPLGTLPILVTDQNVQLDQNLAIHTLIADQSGKLMPKAGTLDRVMALNWLSFVCSDLHKGIGGLFRVQAIYTDKAVQEAVRAQGVKRSHEVIQYVDQKLEGKNYLMGNEFTSADAYAFVVLGWTKWLDVSIASYKNVQKYLERIAARPAVQKVLKEEGLL